MEQDPTGVSDGEQKRDKPPGHWTGGGLGKMSCKYDVACVFEHLNYVPRQKKRTEAESGRERGSVCLLRRVMIYPRERATPRAEPSAGCWDWPICTLGQRSGGRGLDNRTGRDWSLMGRRHLGGRNIPKSQRVSTPN